MPGARCSDLIGASFPPLLADLNLSSVPIGLLFALLSGSPVESLPSNDGYRLLAAFRLIYVLTNQPSLLPGFSSAICFAHWPTAIG